MKSSSSSRYSIDNTLTYAKTLEHIIHSNVYIFVLCVYIFAVSHKVLEVIIIVDRHRSDNISMIKLMFIDINKITIE